jgi:serine O-acetyltransferase
MWYGRKLSKNNSWIGYNSTFLGIPCFPHGISGIFVSGGSKIGKNAVIFHQVTIGSNTLLKSGKFGSPEIGDNVYIGAGAKIIGNIRIGNNCRIGANAVVYKDLPDNSVAVQSPTRIIQKDKLDNRFFSQVNRNKWVFFNNGKWEDIDLQ